MRLYVYILALVLHQSLLLCSAHPPTYSGEPPNVEDSGGSGGGGGGDDDYGGSTLKQPNLTTYITTSSSIKSSTSTSSSTTTHPAIPTTTTTTTTATSSKVPTTNSSSQTPTSSAMPTVRMHPAFAYEATLPAYKEYAAVGANNNNNNYNDAELDGESSKKIIGSSVVTSVSVILNGNEPQFTNALGHKVPKPQPSLQVASPINLLNPDRYEFYTFDDNGELVKRLMTMQEIQSIVANGDGEGPSIIHTAPVNERDPEKNVQDIVNSVQNVLNKEVESTKNVSVETPMPILDTPDVSSSWSMILPAIFGNTGGNIFPQQKPQQIVMTPDAELVETSTKLPTATRATKKPKPSKRKPGQKRKPTTTTTTSLPTPQVVQEELEPHESVYTGQQQYQSLAASNMQTFDAFSAMNMQPIYHKLPTEAVTETTTRRVFVNNQEMIQTTSAMRPAMTTEKTLTTELSENHAKKPAGINTKQNLPHRTKPLSNGTPGHISRHPVVVGNKHKIKKKTTTTTTTTTPEPTTTTPEITTTPETTITPETSTTITQSTPLPKKKKKKPSRTPGHKPNAAGVGGRPHPVHDKRVPSPRPKPAHKPLQQDEQQHYPVNHNKHRPAYDTEAASSVQQEATQQYTQVNHHKQRPRPTATTTIRTTTIAVGVPEGSVIIGNSPTYSPDHISTTLNAATYSSALSPAYPVPSYDSSFQQSQPTSNYVSENVNLEKKPLVSLTQIKQQQHSKPVQQQPTQSALPVSTYPEQSQIQHTQQEVQKPQQQTNSYLQQTQSTSNYVSEDLDAINLKKKPLPSLSQMKQQQTKPVLKQPVVLHNQPPKQPTYPEIAVIQHTQQAVHKPQQPTYTTQEESQETTLQAPNRVPQLPKPPAQPLQPTYQTQPPTYQTEHKLQQPVYQTQEEPQRPVYEDQNTKLSFDQIMQSLQHNDNKDLEKPGLETVKQKEPSKKPTIQPTKYDSAETIEELEEIVNKKKKPVLVNTMSPLFAVATTMVPLTAHYGGSTLSTMLSEETSEAMTSRPFTQSWSTDSASTEDTTTTSSEELNTPVVIITARPNYLVTTTTMPEKMPLPHETETTSVPPYGQLMDTTAKVDEEIDAYTEREIVYNPTETAPAVTNFQPLYADIQEPVVTEITTEEPTPINNYNEDETSSAELSTENEYSAATSESTNNVKKIGMPRLPVMIPQKVNTYIAVGGETTEQAPMVANLKPHLNLQVLKPTEQIAMSEFQTQAATVASTLVDGSNTLAADSFMSSNETKDELAFLMTDVLKQITNEEQSYKLQPAQENTNRLTGFAQLNSSFLLKPLQVSASHKPQIAAAVPSYSETASKIALDSTIKLTTPISPVLYTEAADKTETIYQPVTVIKAPHSTTTKPVYVVNVQHRPVVIDEPTVAHVNIDKPDPVYSAITVTKSPALEIIDKDKPDPIYKPLPVIKIPEIVDKPQLLIPEATTIIPSKEEIIKKEEAYLSLVKQQLLDKAVGVPVYPEELVEATTFKVPLLSLSQIYAQQQQEEDDKDVLYEVEREKLTLTQVIQDIVNKTTEQAEAAAIAIEEEDDELTATITDNDEENDEREVTEEVSEGESSEKSSLEKESTEAAPVYVNDAAEINSVEKADQLATTPVSAPAKVTYAEMINAEEQSTEKETNEQLYATIINQSDEASTEQQSTEKGYVTMINESQTQKAELADTNYTDKTQTTEEVNDESSEKQPSVEYDSITNAAQPQPEYAADPSTLQAQLQYIAPDTSTEIDRQQVTEAYASDPTQAEYGSLPESTEIPGVTAIVYTDSDMVQSSEQNIEDSEIATEKYAQSTEVSNETADELSATISAEAAEESAEPEDPYIKLGEIANKHTAASETKLEQSEEEKPTYNLPELLKPLVTQVKQPDQWQNSDDASNDGHQAMMPVMNYGQTPEQEDEEDEDDQVTYQAPALVLSSSSTTTTTAINTPRSTIKRTTTPRPTTVSTTKRLNTLKPVSYYKQPAFTAFNQAEQPPKASTYTAASSLPGPMPPAQRPMQRPAALSNLMHTSTQATRPPVKLEPSPTDSKGLEASIANLDEDVLQFARLCNELAFSYWKSITSEKISSARSLVISPFALTSMLSMVFLGARGGTSGEMNEVLKLDDMVTFNPHLVFKNITESVEKTTDSDVATTAFVREIFSDRANGKILQFFKEKTQQLYAGHVEEVNFHVVNDIIRRRTNLLVKRHTMGKVLEYLRTNSVWVNGPLATISANLFQTDCSRGSTHDRDGEIFFQVHPSVRQRRLIPIPAVLYKNGFTAGYEPKLDATVVAFGRIEDTVSTIYVMPGHQSSVSPTDNLDRLERELIELAISENAWSNLLTSLMDRPDMEVQLPRFSHRSFVNASLGLQKMGLKGLFKSELADLRGLTGSSNRDIYLSDMIQINTFSTCGEDKISDHHHVEMYPAPPLRKRNKDVDANEDDEFDSSEAIIDFGSLVQESALGRGFYDDLLDPKFLELPLPLRPRQARVPDSPRLRFDKPFLYFVRHNPTGMILFMGRFNPRLLP